MRTTKTYSRVASVCALMLCLSMGFSSCTDPELEEFVYVKAADAPAQLFVQTAQGLETITYTGEVVDKYAKYSHKAKEANLFQDEVLYVSNQKIEMAASMTLQPTVFQQNAEEPLAFACLKKQKENYKGQLAKQNAEVIVKFKNVPNGQNVLSTTMRALKQPQEAPVYFSCRNEYQFETAKLTELSAIEALSNYAAAGQTLEHCQFLLFPKNLSKVTIQMEVILSNKQMYCFQVKGENFAKSTQYEYVLDFAGQGVTTTIACPYDKNYSYSLGAPIELNGVWYAPQNTGCDYYGQDYPSFYSNDTDPTHNLAEGWTAPTEAQMQALAAQPHSAPWAVGALYGIWVGPTADATPQDGNNIFLPFAGYSNGKTVVMQKEAGFYVLHATDKIAHITAEGITIEARPADFVAASLRAVHTK